MKSLFLLPCMVAHLCVAELSFKMDFARNDLTAEERTEFVTLAKQQSFEEVIPFILDVYVKYKPDPSVGINNCDWNSVPAPWKTYVMARAVWNHHIQSKQTPEKTELLLNLLKEATNPSKKVTILYSMGVHQWSETAEPFLNGIATNSTVDLSVRSAAIYVLLYNKCDINNYVPTVVDIILLHDEKTRPHAFSRMPYFGSLTPDNKDQLVSTGFKIISEMSEEDLGNGYFVATRLGSILDIPNDFKPDQKDEKWKNGLGDDFFIDTVKNALLWYSENNATNQILDPTWTTPVLKAESDSQAGQD